MIYAKKTTKSQTNILLSDILTVYNNLRWQKHGEIFGNGCARVVPLQCEKKNSLPPTPPKGRGALPLRGLGDG